MNGELLKGHLDFLILAAVEVSPSHGYAIIEHLSRRSRGAFTLPEGTVYPALHRLEEAGLLTSRWSTHAGRRRRVYRLSRPGEKALAEHRHEWVGFSRAVGLILGGRA
jgi:DNA-binding PadR family transcriptional regulator